MNRDCVQILLSRSQAGSACAKNTEQLRKSKNKFLSRVAYHNRWTNWWNWYDETCHHIISKFDSIWIESPLSWNQRGSFPHILKIYPTFERRTPYPWISEIFLVETVWGIPSLPLSVLCCTGISYRNDNLRRLSLVMDSKGWVGPSKGGLLVVLCKIGKILTWIQ